MTMDIRTLLNNSMTRVLVVLVALAAGHPVMAAKKNKVKSVQPVITVELDENDQRRFNYFFTEAVRQQQLGHYAAAFDLFGHCLDINPAAPEVYYSLSSYYSEMRDDVAMLQAMEKAAELSVGNDTYLERLGQAYLKNQDLGKAVDVYERLSTNNPQRTDVLSILLQLYQHDNNYDKMIETLNRLETIEGSSEDITLSKMQVYSLKGDKKKEFNELKSLARQHPNDYNYRVMMGNWLLQNGKKKQALAEYNAVLKREPDNIMAQMSLLDYYRAENQDSLAKAQTEQLLLSKNTETESKVLLMRQFISDNEENGGDSTEVLALFDRLLAQPQPNATMAELQAAYMSLKKMPQDSIHKALGRVLEIEPDNTGARIQLLQAAWEAKDFDRIISLAKPGTEYNPDNIWFYYFLGLAYSQKDDKDNALDTFKKGVDQANDESNKGVVSDFYSIMGDLLHEKGQNEEAYQAYEKSLEWKADNIGCLNNYAYYLSLENRELPKAEQMSYRTIKAEPTNATYLDTYAWILFKQQRYEEARIYIDQALANDTAVSAVVMEHAGDIYAMNDNIEKAVDLWQTALDMNEEENALLERKIKLRKYLEE